MSQFFINPGANIRALREAYGETQLDLAHALGFDSPATISMYESGERGQNRMDVISAIAAHYRITEDELLHGDFSGLRFGHLPLSDQGIAFQLFDVLLPIQTREQACEDPVFRFIHTIHRRYYKKWKDDLAISESEFELCIRQYRESLTLYKTPESAANLLWWIIFQGLHILYPLFENDLRRVFRQEITVQDFFRKQYLRSPLDPVSNEGASSDPAIRFHQQDDSLTTKCLRFLYANEPWRPLAEYYASLLYAAGLIRNHHTDAENLKTGREMMKFLALLGNSYALALQDAWTEFHKV